MNIKQALAHSELYQGITSVSGQPCLAAHDTNSKVLEAKARVLVELFLKKIIRYSDEVAKTLIYIFIYQVPSVLRTDENIAALTALPEGDLENAKLAIGQLPAPFRSQENLNRILLNPSRALSVCRAFNQMPGDFPYNLKSQESLESLFAYRDSQVIEKLFYTFSQNDYYCWRAFFGALVDDTRIGFEFLLKTYEAIGIPNIESAMRLRPRRDLLEKVVNAYHSKPLQDFNDLIADELGTTVYSELLNELRDQYPAFFPNNFETAFQCWANKMKRKLDYLTFKAEGMRWFIEAYIKKAHFRRLIESGASAGAGAGAEPDIGESTREAWQQIYAKNPSFVFDCINSIMSELLIHSSDPLSLVTDWLNVDFRARAAWSELHIKFNGRLSAKSAAQLWTHLAALKDSSYSEMVQAGQSWIEKQLDIEEIWQALIGAHPQLSEENLDQLKRHLHTFSGQPYDEVVAAGQKWISEELDVDRVRQTLIAAHPQLSNDSKIYLSRYLVDLVNQSRPYDEMLTAAEAWVDAHLPVQDALQNLIDKTPGGISSNTTVLLWQHLASLKDQTLDLLVVEGQEWISAYKKFKSTWYQIIGSDPGLSKEIQTELWDYLLSLIGRPDHEIIRAGMEWLEIQRSLQDIWRKVGSLPNYTGLSQQAKSDLWQYICSFQYDSSGTADESIIYRKAVSRIQDLISSSAQNSDSNAMHERSAVLNVRCAPPEGTSKAVQQKAATTCLMILKQMNQTSGPAGAARGSQPSAPDLTSPAAAGCG